MIDPTLWTFVTAVHTEIQYNSIIVTTVCTVFAFIIGITCGLIAVAMFLHCGKEKPVSKEKQMLSMMRSLINIITLHGIPNTQLELNNNVAY